MKSRIIKFFIWLLVLPILLLLGGFIYISQNQDVLVTKGIRLFNSGIQGEIKIESSKPSFFSNFPYISIDLQGVQIYEDKNRSFLIGTMDDLYLGFDLWKLLQNDYSIKKIKISGGSLKLIKDQDQKINLLQALNNGAENDTLQSEGIDFDLASIILKDMEISYHDLSDSLGLAFQFEKLSTSIKNRASIIRIGLDSRLIANITSKEKPTFFYNKNTGLKLKMVYEKESQILQLNKSRLQLEEALFDLNGKVDLKDTAVDFDLQIEGRKPDFNMLAAFMPNDLAEGLNRYKNQGDVFFRGSISGVADEENMPAINLEFGCENAFFLKTANDKKLDELQFNGFFTNGSERNLRTSEFRLLNFNAKPGKGTFQANLIIKDFYDPYVKINLLADLDLDFVGEFFELEGFEGMSGEIKLSMDFDELQDVSINSPNMVQLKESIQSELVLRNLTFSMPGLEKPIEKMNARAIMREGALNLEQLELWIGSSDLSLSGFISDFPAIFHRLEVPVQSKVKVKSNLFVLEEIFGENVSREVIKDFSFGFGLDALANELFEFKYLPKGKFIIDELHVQLEKFPHLLHDFKAEILIGEEDLSIRDFKGEVDQTDFLLTGRVENYPKWFEEVKTGKSSFHLDLVSNKIRINDLLTYDGENYLPESYREQTLKNVMLKASIDINYEEKFKSLDLNLKQLKGNLSIHPLKLESFSGRANWEDGFLDVRNFGGKMGESEFMIDLDYQKPGYQTKGKNEFRLRAKKLDLDALKGFEGIEKETDHESAFNIFELSFPNMSFGADIEKLKYHTYWLEEVKLQARTDTARFLYLDTLSFRLADGSLHMHGYFNGSDPDNIYMFSNLKADRLDIDQLLFKVDNMGQDFLINENLKGRISGNIKSKFKVYPDFTPMLSDSEATFDLTVYDGTLINFAPMQALSGFFGDRNLNRVRFDTLSNTFELKNGTIYIPKMDISTSLGFIQLSGRQSLDKNMDYFIRVPLSLVTQVGFRALFGGRNREEIDPDREDAIISRDGNRRVRFVNIHMSGTPDNYQVRLRRQRN